MAFSRTPPFNIQHQVWQLYSSGKSGTVSRGGYALCSGISAAISVIVARTLMLLVLQGVRLLHVLFVVLFFGNSFLGR